MDSNLTEKLQSILSDKETVDRLKQLAENMDLQNLVSSEDRNKKEAQPKENTNEEHAEDKSISQYSEKPNKRNNEDHIKLILAIKPYLSPERQEMADNIIRLLKLMKLADINKLLRG